jgi:hypothetical protein
MTRTLSLAIAALVVAFALPTAASATIRIDADADPLAPSGRTPMVIFQVTGLTKHRLYRLSAGMETTKHCRPALGNLNFLRARTRSLEWDPRPDYFFTDPWMLEQTYGVYEPCRGTYKGTLLVKKHHGARTLIRFTLDVPSLRIRYRR